MSRPAKAAVWFTVCYVIQRGMQFLSMPILTRLMSADDYGVYTLFQSWFNVLCVIASWNIFAGAFSKALVKYGKSKDAYTSSALTFTTVLTLCFSVIVLLFHKQISEYIGFSSTLQLLMCANLLLFPALQFWSYRQRFEYRYRGYGRDYVPQLGRRFDCRLCGRFAQRGQEYCCHRRNRWGAVCDLCCALYTAAVSWSHFLQ